VNIAKVRVTLDGAVTVPPAAAMSGGQNVRHPPVQVLPPAGSEDSV
jgi:hypothetical protein